MKKAALCLTLGLLFSVPAFADNSTDVLTQAAALYQQGQYAQAVSVYQAGIQADPNNWQAYQGLGSSLCQLQQYQAALQAYDQCLAVHPDNPALKTYVDTLRARLGPAAPAAAAPASSSAMSLIPTTGGATDEKQALADFENGKALELKGRTALQTLDQAGSPLSDDGEYIARYGAPKSTFYDPHFTLDWGILTPTLINLDLGLFITPTTNVGVAFCYIPLPEEDYEENPNPPYDDTIVNIPGDIIYIEPHIKFYSAPSGLTTYNGFSAVYWGAHEGTDSYGDTGTNFDVFGLGYMFGFRTLPMDGLTMELGWKLGVAVIFTTQETENYNYSLGYYTYGTTSVVIPIPYIIPEFRFGFTF